MDVTSTGGIELHIGELVLHGFNSRDRAAIGQAVEQELARLLSEHGVPGAWLSGGEVDRLTIGQLSLPRGARGPDVGQQVAQAIYRGFSR